MKGMFAEYKALAPQEYSKAWADGLFVFDTNVLLNFYRYRDTTRNDLTKILSKLAARIWVPHHVALEFQRNRLEVIAEQNRRFSEVEKTIDKAQKNLADELGKMQLNKRHASIDPEPLIKDISKITGDFLANLKELKKIQQPLTKSDPLQSIIEELFDGRVGASPKDQAAVEVINKEAEYRYKLKIPPGYQDSEKSKDDSDAFLHNGIIYKGRYGDFLVWKQILEHAKTNNIKHLIFVTDDAKEDWWRTICSDGDQTIGPRPELAEEAKLLGGIETFLMYKPDGFLKFAKSFLKADVSKETLDEVRDVSQVLTETRFSLNKSRNFASQVEFAVYNWLLAQYENVERNRFGFPDFGVEQSGRRLGFEVKALLNPRLALMRLRTTLSRAYVEIGHGAYSEITIIIVVPDPIDIKEVKHMCVRVFLAKIPKGIKIVLGTIVQDPATDENCFIPCETL